MRGSRSLPLSNRGIVLFSSIAMGAILLVGFVGFLFGINITTHLFISALTCSLVATLAKFVHDNTPLPIASADMRALLSWSIILWLPIGVIGLFGFVFTSWCDDKIEDAVATLNEMSNNTVHYVDKTIDEEIDKDVSVWWNPFTWGDIVKDNIQRKVQVPLVQGSDYIIRAFFGMVYSVLRLAQYIYYSICLLAIFRSFTFVLVRVAVWQGLVVQFKLPRR